MQVKSDVVILQYVDVDTHHTRTVFTSECLLRLLGEARQFVGRLVGGAAEQLVGKLWRLHADGVGGDNIRLAVHLHIFAQQRRTFREIIPRNIRTYCYYHVVCHYLMQFC